MMMKVYRDQDGVIRQIGEWDYMESLERGEVVVNNPLPAEYTHYMAEVTEHPDGSRTVD